MKNLSSSLSYDYYWRDYTGEIPGDAIEGGRDVNNKVTYIGQVFVKNHGLIPVTIYPGKTSVAAAIHGVHNFNNHIKILCSSSKQNFKWVPADAKTLHAKMIKKHLVRGGVEHDLISNIGRISYQGEVIVSKVCGYKVGDAKLYFPAGNKETNVESYEVLMYDN
ncbi:uncharacterized protein LOC108904397 [Anoplophora glabripennis]|uniref:Uncharacterized protein n=1 Tax=Anoplophora glabripennis TaxID=217634 RepID=V5I9V2_ANOGL|nr:uncharacterized protein LOC108904397 [Anoplophora glabripennis]